MNMKAKELRRAMYGPIYALSAASGVPPSVISAVERHSYRPGPTLRAKLCLALGCPEDELFALGEQGSMAREGVANAAK